MKKPIKYIVGSILLAGLLTAGASSCSAESSSSTNADEKVSEDMLRDFQRSQPVEVAKYSQYRENLRDVLRTQVTATATTTFLFNQGVQDPIMSCSSIGFPIPSTAQLTNPQKIEDRYEGDVAIPQVEPNGVFTGESSGTYVVCRDANGRAFGDYWEGNVNAVTGPAEWDYDKKQIVLIGAPTGDFSTGK